MRAIVMTLDRPHIWMCGALVEPICICGELGFEHQVVEFGDSEGAPLATGKDLGLK